MRYINKFYIGDCRLQNTKNSASYRGKFTLLELLLVVAVIMILFSILLPALGKAKETANKITCAGNMKQIGYSLMTYGMDNSDTIIPSLYSATYWSGHLKSTGYLGKTPYYDPPINCEPVIFSCPSQKIAYLYSGTYYLHGRISMSVQHYTLNASLSRLCSSAAIASGTAYVIKLSAIKKPSQALWMCDANFYVVNAFSAVSPPDFSVGSAFVYRHNKGINVYFLDGHYEYWTYSKLMKMKSLVGTTDGNAVWSGL